MLPPRSGLPDKRDECGCHRDCTVLPHDCDHPCIWPDCLSEAEHQTLRDELEADTRAIAEGIRDFAQRVVAEAAREQGLL